MRRPAPAIVTLFGLFAATAALADDIQTDWSGGIGAPGVVGAWDREFAGSAGVSWLCVPGQLSLSGVALAAGEPTLLAAGQAGAFGVEAADLDGDGDVDIIGSAELAGTLTVWDNGGDHPPTFTARVVDGAYPNVSGVCAADLDGDRDLDLVACTGTINGRLTCYLNDGGSPAAWTPRNLETNWSESWEIATGDVDGDGRLDVIGTNLGAGDVVWWRNDGADPIGWTRLTVDASFSGAHSARVGDIDGDGRADILGTGTTVNQVAWWRNGGGEPPTWSKSVIATGFFGGRSVRLGDIDGDGDLDAAACGFNNRVTWWANQGGQPVTWVAQVVSASVAQAHQLQLADVNGDGRLDIVAAAYGSNSITWFANGGGTAPITWTRYTLDNLLAGPLAVNVGDIDGDGALEVIGASNAGNLFRTYEATTFAAEGTLTGSVLDRGGSGAAILDWSAATPAGTAAWLEVRSGDSPDALGPWSLPLETPGAVIDPAGRYLQYRATLQTSDPAVSPRLAEVALRRDVSAVPGRQGGLGLRVHPNPANPRAMVTFDLPRAGEVRLAIFDQRGRLVRRIIDAALVSGHHEVAWDGADDRGRAAASGSYHAALTTSQGTVGARVTLVR